MTTYTKPVSIKSVVKKMSICAVLAMTGCSPGSNLSPLADSTVKTYQLGQGDQVRIITFGEDQLTGDFRVDDTGTIALPLLGSVPAAGLTTPQLSGKISEALIQRKLLQAPSVAVEVSEYRPIFILGEVSKPGQYPFRPGMTVLSAVSVAGGFTYRAIPTRASIIRTEGDKAVEGRATRQAFVEPGDVITIFERIF